MSFTIPAGTPEDLLPESIRAAVGHLSTHPGVSAIALAGSRSGPHADDESDHDVYVYVDTAIPLALRRELAERFDPAPEIGNTWFGPGDEWTDRHSGTAIDLIYWDRKWFEREIRDVIERHRPSLGYSTALWHTLRHSVPLFDRDGWLASLRQLATTPYPDELRRAIVAWNHPLLRTTRSSHRHQIELAIRRDDPVSVQHRVTALLASVFDIVFALNGTLHPGEKRQLAHIARLGDGVPDQFEHQVRALIRATGAPGGSDVLVAIDALCDTIDDAIRHHGLWDAVDRWDQR